MRKRKTTKTHWRSTGKNRRDTMFKEPGNPMCPVSLLEKYLSKLPPDAKALYLHPKRRFEANDTNAPENVQRSWDAIILHKPQHKGHCNPKIV